MMNPFRNEMLLKLGGQDILLRPTFENIASMEATVGAISYLGWKYSRGARLAKDGGAQSVEALVKAMPPLSEVAQIIFHNQAATHPEDPTKKKYTLEEIWDLVQAEGVKVIQPVTVYLSKIVAGGTEVDEVKEAKKE